MTAQGGLDYSTKALHFAVVDGPRLIDAWGDVLAADTANRLVQMVRACRRLKDHGVTRLTLEAPWFRVGAGSNAATLALHRVVYHFEAVAVSQGLEIAFVPIATWRMVVLGNGRPKQPKAEAIWYASAVYKYATKNDNQADAICLAAYGDRLARSRVPNTTTYGSTGKAIHTR